MQIFRKEASFVHDYITYIILSVRSSRFYEIIRFDYYTNIDFAFALVTCDGGKSNNMAVHTVHSIYKKDPKSTKDPCIFY